MIFASNKGQEQILFLLLIVVVLVAFGFASYIGNKVLTSVNDQIQSSEQFDNTSKDAIGGIEEAYPSVTDNILGVILILMWIGGLALSWFSDSNPLILVVLIIVTLVLGIVGGILSNTWDTFQAEYPSYATSYPITNFVLNNYLVVVLGMGVSFIAAGFLKTRFA